MNLEEIKSLVEEVRGRGIELGCDVGCSDAAVGRLESLLSVSFHGNVERF